MKTFTGTIARAAIQCTDPRSGKRGTWLYSGSDHRDPDAAQSPLFADLYELFQWTRQNRWEPIGDAYRYMGGAQ